MGIKIMTDDKGIRVWRSDKYDKPRYSISTNTKDGDSWIRDYQEVCFKKGVEVRNGETIFITNAFPTVRTWVNKDTQQQFKKTVWMITDFTTAEDSTYVAPPTPIPEAEGFTQADDDIPF